jgi:F0F1-type ATP synthase assembly protein I
MMLWVGHGEVGMNKWIPAFRLTGIGFYIATCIVGGILAGWWLGDKKPLFIIIGLLVGLVLAFYGMYRMIKPLMKDKNDDKEDGR